MEKIDLIEKGITTSGAADFPRLFSSRKLTWLKKGLRLFRGRCMDHYSRENWPDWKRDYDNIYEVLFLLVSFSEKIDLIEKGITTRWLALFGVSFQGENWPDWKRDYDWSIACTAPSVRIWRKLTWLKKGLRHKSCATLCWPFNVEKIDLIEKGITTVESFPYKILFCREKIDLIEKGITTLLSFDSPWATAKRRKLTWLKKGLRPNLYFVLFW